MPRTCDWRLRLSLDGASIRRVVPAWQAGPYEERRRDRVLARGERFCEWRSFTSRAQAFAEDPTKAMLFEFDGPESTVVRLEVMEPAPGVIERTLGELARASAAEFTGPFTAENVQIERLIAPASYEASLEITDERTGADWYHVRVTQANGQMAWSSPIWVG